MKRADAGKTDHSAVRFANRAHRSAMADEAAALAPELRRIAAKYGYSPHTVAKVALARARV